MDQGYVVSTCSVWDRSWLWCLGGEVLPGHYSCSALCGSWGVLGDPLGFWVLSRPIGFPAALWSSLRK